MSDHLTFYGLNRTLCDVFKDMRSILELDKVSRQGCQVLRSLVEEAQVMGNRMEAAINEQNDLEYLHRKIKEAKKELKDLEDKKGAK